MNFLVYLAFHTVKIMPIPPKHDKLFKVNLLTIVYPIIMMDVMPKITLQFQSCIKTEPSAFFGYNWYLQNAEAMGIQSKQLKIIISNLHKKSSKMVNVTFLENLTLYLSSPYLFLRWYSPV